MSANSSDKPRIGLLTYGLDRPLSGVTRVALELGQALRDGGECEVVFLTPYRSGPFREGDGGASWYLPGCARLPGLMLLGGPLIALAARRLRLDVVHDPVGVSPFTVGKWAGTFKRVVTIHDAIAFRYPQGYPWLNNVLHRHYVPATLGQVDAVITISQYARQELAHFIGLTANRAHVIANGVHSRFQPIPPDVAGPIAKQYGLEGPYVLSVGALQARKNLDRLLAAFAQLHAELPDYRLAIAGPTLWGEPRLQERIVALGLEQSVAALGYVPDDHLPALYSMARLFVFPSLWEGFGLPVLEAMACGTPAVCSNATALPEVAGGAAILVDSTNVDELAGTMRNVLSQPALLESLRQAGLKRAREFSWERTASETVAVYRQLLAG